MCHGGKLSRDEGRNVDSIGLNDAIFARIRILNYFILKAMGCH